MRIRTIKPEFWQNEKLAALPALTRLLAIGLLNYADDEGFFINTPALIRAAIFPFMEDSRNIHGMLSELSIAEWVTLGIDADQREIGLVTNFLKHQKISHPQPTRIVGFKPHSRNVQGTFNEHSSLNGMERNREQGKEQGIKKESNKKKNPGKMFVPPTLEQLENFWKQYHAERGIRCTSSSAEEFLDYYASKGWKVGTAPMKSWEHAAARWIRNNAARGNVFSAPQRRQVPQTATATEEQLRRDREQAQLPLDGAGKY